MTSEEVEKANAALARLRNKVAERLRSAAKPEDLRFDDPDARPGGAGLTSSEVHARLAEIENRLAQQPPLLRPDDQLWMDRLESSIQPAAIAPSSTMDDRKKYAKAILSEIRVMLDYLAANPAKTIQDLKFDDPEKPTEKLGLTLSDVLARLDAIDEKLEEASQPLSHVDLALLQVVRDTFSRLAAPASGLSIAYTALVTGTPWIRGSGKSRTKLAEDAYPDFITTARIHRIFQILLLILSIGLTAAAVWESTKVALGKSLLQNLERLRIQQIALVSEKAKLESTLDKVAPDLITFEKIQSDKDLPLQFFSLCNRQYVLKHSAAAAKIELPKDTSGQDLELRSSSPERDTCDRDHLLAINFRIAQDDLRQYYNYWPRLAGSSFESVAHFLNKILVFQPIRNTECAAQAPGPSGNGAQVAHQPAACDIELRVAPLLLVWGNYSLPIVFAFLGASIYVILDYFGKVRDSRLLPRDSHLSSIRLVLGLVTGACIGLFFSSYGPTSPGAATDLISSLSLSASGVAFLAGFGVEGVFTMLEGLVSRVFPSQQK
jgi:hypothetical protein